MSGGFIMNQLRDELSRRCVVVRGFLPYTVPYQVTSLFRCQRIHPASDGTWLVLFQNPQDAKEWVTKYSTYSVGNLNLHLTASTPRDIPDAWLQDDQGGSAGVQMPGYPSPGLPGYPGQGYPGIMSPPPQKEQMHANPYTQNAPGPGQPFQYPSPDCRKTGGVSSASGPQVVMSDPVSHKASMNPTIYQNYPSMPQPGNFPSMPQSGNFPSMPQPGAPPSYESHNFKPKVPPRHSISKSSEAMQREPSTMKEPDVMESINRSSDEVCTSVPAEESRPPDSDSIRVSCLPRGVSEEFISDFFENVKRSGGGDVADVKYDEQNNMAIVTFEDLNVVKSVLKKHESSSLQMNKQQIEIEEYHPKADDESLDRSEEIEEPTAIKVTNLPPRVSEEQLELFFENHRKSGGGEVERVEYDVDTNSAVVWFKDTNDVASVLQKQESAPLMINKQAVEVEEYRPHQGDNLNSSVEEESGGALKVTKLPRGTSEEQILLFFENRKKSGGGEVEKVDYDEAAGSAVVWFTDADVVSSVLQKVPLLFNKKQIHVEEVRMDGEKMEKEAEDAATGSRCTIEVRGMADKTSTDSVELYFDNKRKSGGGDVKEVKGEVEDGVLYITFESEETVERVLKREHKIDGSILNVKLYQPPKPKPMYPDRVLIKGFKPETTKDGLINYLEAKSGEDIKDVVYGQEEGTAIVIFDELKDFSKLEAACLKKPLEKKYLTVKKVPISNCILVSGFTAGTSVDTLEFYFDNEKRSGGGGVQDIKVSEEDDTCLVYFENHAVCDKVCQRSHKVDNQKLTVHVYHECLGQPCNPEIGRKFKPLPPLVVRELELRKMKFVYTSDEIKEALNKQAELTHGKIKWPKRANTELTVECTLTKDVKDCQKLAKTWEKNMADGIHRMLETLQVEAVSVLQETWQKVLEGIKQLNVPNPQKVGIVIEKDKSTIVIVGFRNTGMIDDVKRYIEQITAMVAEEIQERVTEQVTLKHHQFSAAQF